MITVSETAQHEIEEYFREKAVSPIRLYLSRGCGGEQIVMALDSRRESDAVFTVAGIDYIIDQAFLEQAKPIGIDFMAGRGFHITSPLKLETGGGCGGCGTSDGCCS